MGRFETYRGRTIGRVLHAIDTYCKSADRLDENACVSDGNVTYNGRLLATYTWQEPDIPVFEFLEECDANHAGLRAMYIEQQFRLQPFLDDRFILYSVNFAIQDVREKLGPDGVEFFRQVVSRYGRANTILRHDLRTGHLLEFHHPIHAREGVKVIEILRKASMGYWNEDQYNRSWEHIVLCAIRPRVKGCT